MVKGNIVIESIYEGSPRVVVNTESDPELGTKTTVSFTEGTFRRADATLYCLQAAAAVLEARGVR